jgi:hypothetical protein
MPIDCYVTIMEEATAGKFRAVPVLTFAEVPRVGEYVGFSRDAKRDDRGVLTGDLFRVARVVHMAANDLSPPSVTLEVVIERTTDRP